MKHPEVLKHAILFLLKCGQISIINDKCQFYCDSVGLIAYQPIKDSASFQIIHVFKDGETYHADITKSLLGGIYGLIKFAEKLDSDMVFDMIKNYKLLQ